MTRARDVADTQDNVGGSVAPFVAGKNILINGDFAVDQRNSGSSLSVTTSGRPFTVDRWSFSFVSGANVTAQRVTGTNTSTPYALRITGATGSTNFNLSQRIEADVVGPIVGRTVTFNLTVHSSTTVTGVVPFYALPGARDNWTSPTYTTFSAQSLSSGLNTVRVSFTMPAGATNGFEMGVNFQSGLGNGVSVDLANAQLEAGAVITPFSRAAGTVPGELAACQRYYYRIYNPGSAINNALAITGFVSATTQVWTPIQHPVKMRVTPTSLDYANVGFYVFRTGGNYQGGTWAINTSSPDATCLLYTTSGLTINDIGVLNQSINGTNVAYLGLSAEL